MESQSRPPGRLWAPAAAWSVAPDGPRTLRAGTAAARSTGDAQGWRANSIRVRAGAMEHGNWDGAGLVGSCYGHRVAWQRALSVLGQNTSRTAPVRSKRVIASPYRGLAGSCLKILPSAEPGLFGQIPAQALSVMSVTSPQSGVSFPATTGLKRSVPFRPLYPPKIAPAKNCQAVHPTATLPNRLEKTFKFPLASTLIL